MEMLQIYSTKCACKEVQVFLGEVNGAVQGALQDGGKPLRELQAGLCREDAQLWQQRRVLALGAAPGRGAAGAGLPPGHPLAARLLGAGERAGLRARPGCRAPLRILRGVAALLQAGVGEIPVGGFFVLGLPLVLHAAVLEPDLDLPLGEVEQSRDLHPPGPAEVFVEVKFLLQLQQLRVGVRGPEPPGAAGVCQPLGVLNTEKIARCKERERGQRRVWIRPLLVAAKAEHGSRGSRTGENKCLIKPFPLWKRVGNHSGPLAPRRRKDFAPWPFRLETFLLCHLLG